MYKPSESLTDLAEHIQEDIKNAEISYHFEKDELVLQVEAEDIEDVLRFLRDDTECQFRQLMSICGVDYPEREKRFDVVYNLLSLNGNNRIRVKLSVEEDEFVPSSTTIFSTAGWFEREVWDLYGIPFKGHTDLRRILTDYGFEGHPLRKDFPLTGYVELRYDEDLRRVVYEPVKLAQDFRSFDYLSPWEGMTDVQLPGDEKATKLELGWEPSERLPSQAKDMAKETSQDKKN
ncbi:MAG: NADH-quinone oxidoreductase subunit C [Pseudomonadota bacterium]